MGIRGVFLCSTLLRLTLYIVPSARASGVTLGTMHKHHQAAQPLPTGTPSTETIDSGAYGRSLYSRELSRASFSMHQPRNDATAATSLSR